MKTKSKICVNKTLVSNVLISTKRYSNISNVWHWDSIFASTIKVRLYNKIFTFYVKDK